MTVLLRSFVQFDGEAQTPQTPDSAIGGHPAVLLRSSSSKHPDSLYANHDGYVPFGKLVGLLRRPQQRLH